MMKTRLYRQCELSHGTGRTVGWIEERGAILGASVELISGDGEFWTVDTVGDKTITHDQLRFMEGANKHPSIS